MKTGLFIQIQSYFKKHGISIKCLSPFDPNPDVVQLAPMLQVIVELKNGDTMKTILEPDSWLDMFDRLEELKTANEKAN